MTSHDSGSLLKSVFFVFISLITNSNLKLVGFNLIVLQNS